jgi:hypothetical protein
VHSSQCLTMYGLLSSRCPRAPCPEGQHALFVHNQHTLSCLQVESIQKPEAAQPAEVQPCLSSLDPIVEPPNSSSSMFSFASDRAPQPLFFQQQHHHLLGTSLLSDLTRAEDPLLWVLPHSLSSFTQPAAASALPFFPSFSSFTTTSSSTWA